MQLMNVEGLTRENVASHLQKYRLYLKRMQGLSNEGPSSSDPLFSSTPVPQSLNEARGSGHVPMPMPTQMTHPPQMMHMAVMGMAHGSYQGYESSPYNMLQQRDWSGSKFGSVASYQHVTPNDKWHYLWRWGRFLELVDSLLFNDSCYQNPIAVVPCYLMFAYRNYWYRIGVRLKCVGVLTWWITTGWISDWPKKKRITIGPLGFHLDFCYRILGFRLLEIGA